jgi:hypothetical protein
MRRNLLPLTVLIGALAAPGAASAATTLGELAPAGEPAAACLGCSFFSSAADAVPSSGVITRWAMRPGASTPAGNRARLRVFRPVDGDGRVRMVAESASAPLTQGFTGADVRVPVEAGDRRASSSTRRAGTPRRRSCVRGSRTRRCRALPGSAPSWFRARGATSTRSGRPGA